MTFRIGAGIRRGDQLRVARERLAPSVAGPRVISVSSPTEPETPCRGCRKDEEDSRPLGSVLVVEESEAC